MRIKNSVTTQTKIKGAVAIIGMSAMSLSLGVAPAQAQSGYRVCVASYAPSGPNHIGRGMAVKVQKDAGGTCDQKLAYIKKNYKRTFPSMNSDPSHIVPLEHCEDFTAALVSSGELSAELSEGNGIDLCNGMVTNYIYYFDSIYDRDHPKKFDGMHFVTV